MRTLAGLCLSCALAACAFEPSPLAGGPGPSPAPDAAGAVDATAPDAALDTGADAASGDAGSPAAFCDPADPELVGCFRFEDTTDDASGAALAGNAATVGFEQGVSGRAAVFTAASALQITETPALDVAAVTVEMWVRPDGLPVAPARAGLFDNSGQYALFVLDNARLRCSGNGEAIVDGALTVGLWTHVACVHDGQSITLYIDGLVRATGAAGAINLAPATGSNIGSDNPGGNDDFIGRIDELRIWSRPRTPDEICAAAACTAR